MDERAIQVRNSMMNDIKRWTETLSKQLTYLDEVISQLVTSRYINRKSINRVQTLQVLIKTELAKYHKEQQSGTRPYKHIVDRYRIFMKTFSEIVKQTQLVRNLVSIKDPKQGYLSPNKSPKHDFQGKLARKKYMSDTFNVLVNRQLTASRLERVNDVHTPSRKRQQAEQNNLYNVIRTESAKRKARLQRQHRLYEQARASTIKFSRYRSQPIFQKDQQQCYGLKSEMSSLKSLLMGIHKQLQFHRHPQLEDQVHRIKIRYNKMKIKIDTVKQENTVLLENISKLNLDLKKERRKFRQASKDSRLLRTGHVIMQ